MTRLWMFLQTIFLNYKIGIHQKRANQHEVEFQKALEPYDCGIQLALHISGRARRAEENHTNEMMIIEGLERTLEKSSFT